MARARCRDCCRCCFDVCFCGATPEVDGEASGPFFTATFLSRPSERLRAIAHPLLFFFVGGGGWLQVGEVQPFVFYLRYHCR